MSGEWIVTQLERERWRTWRWTIKVDGIEVSGVSRGRRRAAAEQAELLEAVLNKSSAGL
jgi:hypothetical protein